MGNSCCNGNDEQIRKEKKDEKVSKISNAQINSENKNDNFSKIILNDQINVHKKIDENVPKTSDKQVHNEKKNDEKVSKINNNQLINSEKKIDGEAQNISNEQNKPKGVIKANNIFPRGSEYEKELNTNFQYFNVFWYDQNKTNDFYLFKKCFENVQFYKAHDLNSIINFFKKESISEWIVVSSGSKGKELIQNLENINCIKSFFIYCQNTKLHESWAKNIKKVGCITSDPEYYAKNLLNLIIVIIFHTLIIKVKQIILKFLL